VKDNSSVTAIALTDRQKECLAPARNVLISAGAGSGKTLLLVRKMVDLFCTVGPEGGYLGVENVLALTFTRKAAGEMRSRVYKEMLRRIANFSDARLTRHLIEVKDKIHTARISTIHGFASSLIRSYPLETDADPDFEIFDEAIQPGVVERVVRDTLRRRWADRDTKLERVLSLWTLPMLRRTLQYMLAVPIQFLEAARTHQTEPIVELLREIQLQKWEEFSRNADQAGGAIAWANELADRCAKDLEKSATSPETQLRQDLVRQFQDEFVEPLLAFLGKLSAGNADPKVLDDLDQRLQEIGTRLNWRKPALKGPFAELKKAVLPWFESLDRDHAALHWIDDLLDLAQETWNRYEAEKTRSARLAQDDLLLRAHSLCSAHREQVRGGMGHILVDEFQDTDPTQWETILSLAHASDGHPQNLFLVGDAKQAIYAFRGADHTVTWTAQEALRRAEPQQFQERSLAENFRSLPQPLLFTNALFERLFSPADSREDPYAVPAQPLIPKRENAADSHSCVGFLLTQTEEKKDAWSEEARSVALFLKRVARGADTNFIHISDLIRDGKPAVGILFRKYAQMPHYLGELTRAGLPFSVYHGRTFFETPEIQTLTNLLAWLADPLDDVALLGVLRSPLYAWTDEELLRLRDSSVQKIGPLQQRLESMASKSGSDGELQAEQTWRELQKLRKLADHLSLSETLRAALDGVSVQLILGRGLRGAQAAANIEKFLAMVRALEATEGSSAQTVVRAIREQSEAGPGEAEAESPGEQRAAIQLMSIHAAKGLEFPLVILACSGTGRRSNSGVFLKRISLAGSDHQESVRRLTLCGIDFSKDAEQEPPSPTVLKEFLKEHDRLQSEAEEKRLLYVALTRARDHLVMPLAITNGKIFNEEGSHARMILESIPGLAEAASQGEGTIDFGGLPLKLMYDRDLSGDNDDRQGPLCEVELEKIRAATFPASKPLAQTGPMPYPRKVRVSVSDLMVYARCPRRYYFERFFARSGRHLGLAGEESDDGNIVAGERPDRVTEPVLVGTLVHKILESSEALVRMWKPGAPPPRELTEGVTEWISRMKLNENSNEKIVCDEVLRHLGNLSTSGIFAEAGGQEEIVLREIPFEIEEGDCIVTGALDRLAATADGAWHLWDYKTTRLAGRAKEEVISDEAYDVQLRLYAWAAGKVLGTPVSDAGVVFTDTPGQPYVPVPVDPPLVDKMVSDILSEIASLFDKGIEAFCTNESSRACASCGCKFLELC
jgi:ATP-dependent helicase/nuclease subunit A